MKVFLTLIISMVMLMGTPALAQDSTDADNARKMELAQKMHDFRPVRDQVDDAINRYAQTQPEQTREGFKTAMRSVLNYQSLEKISVKAYVDTFTLPELEAMVEYYSKPEARSASDKFNNYVAIVYPEIIKMLDQAAMRVKTGGN